MNSSIKSSKGISTHWLQEKKKKLDDVDADRVMAGSPVQPSMCTARYEGVQTYPGVHLEVNNFRLQCDTVANTERTLSHCVDIGYLGSIVLILRMEASGR